MGSNLSLRGVLPPENLEIWTALGAILDYIVYKYWQNTFLTTKL